MKREKRVEKKCRVCCCGCAAHTQESLLSAVPHNNLTKEERQWCGVWAPERKKISGVIVKQKGVSSTLFYERMKYV